MRILQVCSGSNQLQRGAERFCVSIAESLLHSGHEVTLVVGPRALMGHGSRTMPMVTIPEAINPWLRKTCFDYINPFAVAAFRQHLLNLRPDIVHFHSLYGLSTSLVRIASRLYPVVVTLHDAWLAFSDSGILTPKMELANTYFKVPHAYIHRRINRYHLRDVTLVSPSRWLAKFFEDAGFNSPLHIPNGLLPEGRTTRYDKTLLWVGALTTFKGLPSIIGLVAPLMVELGWRFIVVGDGPHSAQLKRDFPNVIFTSYQDPTPYYKKASILLVTSLGQDNFPTVILEAMRHGVCVVGHRMGGIPELIEDNYNGLLYETDQTLATRLTKLTADDQAIRRLGGAGRMLFEEKYLMETCLGKYTDLYHSLI